MVMQILGAVNRATFICNTKEIPCSGKCFQSYNLYLDDINRFSRVVPSSLTGLVVGLENRRVDILSYVD
jgi:predicted transcriptional regulator with HTH domain